ncbi:MAG TPA: outer membrane beta-barrel protein [Sphingobacteriaceae bacterium]|nr:outer membrane beta-barrel protein [Sphingobacteriaceae bacterium]
MKYIIAILLCCCITAGYSQEKTKKDTVLIITVDSAKNERTKKVSIKINTTTNETDSVKPVKPSSKFFTKFTFSRFDLGLSKFMDNGSFTLSPQNDFLESETWKSSNVGFDLFEMAYRFNNYFKIYLSAGFDWNHMRLKKNITILPDEPTLSYRTEPIDFKKNRFSSNYLRMPLGIQFRTKENSKGKRVYFVTGPEIGFLLNGKVKQVSKEQGKEKIKDDYNFEPFRYGAYARLGYGGLGIFSKYYFNDVFAEGQGPTDFKNLSFGLTTSF